MDLSGPWEYLRRRYIKPFWRDREERSFIRATNRVLAKYGLNVCYNKYARENYRPGMKNILVAIESPAYILAMDWIDFDKEYYAEISFQNFLGLDNYFCCRTLYANHDGWATFSKPGTPKERLISIIFSNKTELEGHRFRHAVATALPEFVDRYGSGVGRYEKKQKTLDPYAFQVVVENGKYPEYVSEKFFDCVKTKTIPVYWGGEAGIKKMGFNTGGMIFFDTIEEAKEIVEGLSMDDYQRMLPAVEENSLRLIELRKEEKFRFFLNPVLLGYFHSPESYPSHTLSPLNLDF